MDTPDNKNSGNPGDDKTRLDPSRSDPARLDKPSSDKLPQQEKPVVSADKTLFVDKTRIAVPELKPESKPVKPKIDEANRPKTDSEKTRFAEPKATNPANTNSAKVRPDASAQPDQEKTRLVNAQKNALLNENASPKDTTKFSPSTRPLPAKKSAESLSAANAALIKNLKESGDHVVLKGRFVLEDMLGAGGMGIVYKAKDLLKIEAQDRDPYVAIKVLSEEFKSHPEAFIALQRESRKTQQIAHPNIVNVYDFDKDGDRVFMTMEFLDGKPLDELIYQYRATGLPDEDSWKILEGISAALIYAHEQNIVHSDFKPGNIFVTNKGVSKVFDFGIARAVAKAESYENLPGDDKTVFDAGNLGALTPAYASKEMLEGKAPDARDDIYALACVAYELFSGKHPFNRVHADEAARQKLKPRRLNAFTRKQWKVIEKGLAFNREDRIESVEEFWQKLTEKPFSGIRAAIMSLVVIGLLGTIGYLYFSKPEERMFSEDDFRSEIELKLRMEQHQTNIKNMLATLEFSQIWEQDLWAEVQAMEKLAGKNNQWLVDVRASIFAAYLEKIDTVIMSREIELAERLLKNAPRYAGDMALLDNLTAALDELKKSIALAAEEDALKRAAEEEKARLARQTQESQIVQMQEENRAEETIKVQRSSYDQALQNVNEQLACRSALNMRDLDIAVKKLREVDLNRYRKDEGKMVSSLASCIAKVGVNFPKRAEEYKKLAIAIFPGNAVIANINIQEKDSCDLSLAGLGAKGMRGSCRDPIGGGNGPLLVVVPAKDRIKAFAIGKYEVSIEDFNVFCRDNKTCKPKTGTDNQMPITDISYTDATAYLRWLSIKTGRKYRMPTDSEWIYAAKANSNKLDPNRNCQLNSRGIQRGNALLSVGIGAQNNWGLVNHIGNAQEWVSGAGGVSYAAGGSYETTMESCTLSALNPHSGKPDMATGFRVLREI
jgi:serine/threonine protein kinase